MRYTPLPMALVALMASASLAQDDDVAYMSDLAPFTLMAPCATQALNSIVTSQMNIYGCGGAAPAVQSCICSNETRSSIILESATSEVKDNCGVYTAPADANSAIDMYDFYCHQDYNVPFAAPTQNLVTDYITDLPAMGYLAPCASSVVSSLVLRETEIRCPVAASLLAPCVCGKQELHPYIVSSMREDASSACDNYEDGNSATNFFSEFCDMNEGTTTFASPDGPPGDMTYYITAIPEFNSLDRCARSALSTAVLRQTSFLCPAGPQALASCACIKRDMSIYVSGVITEEVEDYCGVFNTDAVVTSAIDVFQIYCDAAEDKKPISVTETASDPLESIRTAVESGASEPEETGQGDDGDGDGDEDSGGGGNKTAIIAGSVVGGVVAIAIIAAVAFLVRRKHNKAKHGNNAPEVQTGPHVGAAGGPGGIAEAPEKTYVPNQSNELHGTVVGDTNTSYYPMHEMEGTTVSQFSTPPPPSSSAQQGETGWQSGPVDTYDAPARNT